MVSTRPNKKQQSTFKEDIKYYYRFLDAFGIPNRLYYEGEGVFRTGIGATLTIILVVVLLILSMGVITATFTQSSKDLTTDTIFDEDPPTAVIDG